MPDEHVVKRNRGGKFAKGCSGNPNGRPKGVVSLPVALRKRLPPEKFAEVLAEKAEAGESWACQIVADRYWPKTTNVSLDGTVEVAQDAAALADRLSALASRRRAERRDRAGEPERPPTTH